MKPIAALVLIILAMVFAVVDIACLIGLVVGGNVVVFGMVIGGQNRMESFVQSLGYAIASGVCVTASLWLLASNSKK